MIAAAQAVIRANDRGTYSVPSPRLYPFQWNWDSPFTALGWATFDTDRAWTEIETLLSAQWPDGMVPQIVFHADDDGYYPNRAAWRTGRRSSGISQPPVAASAVRELLDRTGDDARARVLLPRLEAWHRWWHASRDPDGTGLVAILHPWESGRDNNPDWDAPLAAVTPRVDVSALRRDLGHVDAAMRPSHDEYNRYMTLVEDAAALGWQAQAVTRASAFRVCDVGVQSILLRAERDLSAMQARFGLPAAETQARVARLSAAMPRLWHDGAFRSLDLRTARPSDAITSAGFLPLYAGAADAAQVAALAAQFARIAGLCRFVLPSTDPAHPRFDARRYWRGPVWAVVNRMVARGFAEAGHAAIAARIRADTQALIAGAGFMEYFDPLTGQGLGGPDFSWTAAVFLSP